MLRWVKSYGNVFLCWPKFSMNTDRQPEGEEHLIKDKNRMVLLQSHALIVDWADGRTSAGTEREGSLFNYDPIAWDGFWWSSSWDEHKNRADIDRSSARELCVFLGLRMVDIISVSKNCLEWTGLLIHRSHTRRGINQIDGKSGYGLCISLAPFMYLKMTVSNGIFGQENG